MSQAINRFGTFTAVLETSTPHLIFMETLSELNLCVVTPSMELRAVMEL